MKKILLALICLTINLSLLCAKTIYVAARVEKSGDGSKEQPFQSIQEGLDITYAGDTLLILEGGYYPQETLHVKHSGTPDKWVTIMGETGKNIGISGNAVMQTLPENERWHEFGLFHVHNVRYVRIENLQLFDSHNVGFMIRGNGRRQGNVIVGNDKYSHTHNIILDHCKSFMSYGSGVGVWYADSVTVTHCEVVGANDQALRPIGKEFRREAPHEAISIAGSNAFEVSYNHLHLNDKEGIDCKEFSSNGSIHHNYCHDIKRQGIYLDSWFADQQNIEIYANIVHDCGWGICLSAEGFEAEMKNIRIHDNLLYNNRHSGYLISVFGEDNKRQEIYFYNNTIVGNSVLAHWAGRGGGIDFRSHNLAHSYTFNNIVYGNIGFEIAVFDAPQDFKKTTKKKKIVFTNNLVGHHPDTSVSDGYLGKVYPLAESYSIINNPLFVNAKQNDYRLQHNSPAKGKSISLKGYGKESTDLGANLEMLPSFDLFQ